VILNVMGSNPIIRLLILNLFKALNRYLNVKIFKNV